MSMWSLRWHFTNKSVTGAPYSIKRYSLSHSWILWRRVRWLKQCRLQVAAELQQWWRRRKRRRKSIPRSSSSHREGSITQRGASCGRDQRRRRSTPKMPTWNYVILRVSATHLGRLLQSPWSGWWRGVVVSGVRRMNKVNPRRARLVLGWVAVFGRVYHLGM